MKILHNPGWTPYLDTLQCCRCRIVTPFVADSSREAFSHNHLICLSQTDQGQDNRGILGVVQNKGQLILHMKMKFMILSYNVFGTQW